MNVNRHFCPTGALSAWLLPLALMAYGCGSDAGGGGDSSVRGDARVPGGDGGASSDGGSPDGGHEPTFAAERPDYNGDGALSILILGTTQAVRGGTDEFAPDAIAAELSSILAGAPGLSLTVDVAAEDIHRTTTHATGPFSATDRVHSMLQYYYWPDGESERHELLSGNGAVDWDHVIIASDPRIVSRTPGYFALGVHKVAERVRSGNAEPRLLLVWPSSGTDAPIDQLEEFTYRAAHGALEPMRVVPAGLAWAALRAEDQDTSAQHPTPNGAYLAAASIYSQLFGESASTSSYMVNDSLADVAHATVQSAASERHYSGPRTQVSGFSAGAVSARTVLFHQTGTSSEAGVLRGLRRASSNVTFTEVADDAPFAHFNYGRANQWYEDEKEYTHDPSRFDYSVGFPMQDDRDIDGVPNAGDVTMRYGLDARVGHDPTSTDLGIALYMFDNGQLPEGRAIPIRALYAQAREAYGLVNPAEPAFSAFRDAQHMSNELDTASGAFLYTMLTGHCSLAAEPADTTGGEWKHWVAHRVGYETAWTMMHLRRRAPGFRVIPESAASVTVTPEQGATLSVSFANPPTSEVVVRFSTDNPAVVAVSPAELRFSPQNHATAQVVTLTGLPGASGDDTFTLLSTSSSHDPDFDAFVDRWSYRAVRP